MKKFLIVFFLLSIFSAEVFASDLCDIKYKNISNKSKISYSKETNTWSQRINKKDEYFIKTKGFGNYYDYLKSNKDFAFTTDCEYEFIADGNFIGYSNSDFQFYKFIYENGVILKTLMSQEEVSELFPEYTIIKLSEFSEKTNSLKIKKGFGDLKIIIYNDKNINLDKFTFSTGNSEIVKYPLSGFLNIKKKGMIQLSKEGESMTNSSWFVLLVR